MKIFALLLGLALLWGYVAAATYSARKVWTLLATRAELLRVLLSALVLAVFFAPVLVGAGHGVGLEPAWVALVDPASNRFAVKHAFISLAGTWALFFFIGEIVLKIRKHRSK